MHDILSKLDKLEYKKDFIEEIKQEQLPLLMWGCGELADEIYAYIQKNNIPLEGVFVDEAYHVEGTTFKNFPVLSSNDVACNYDKVNIILGCSNYEKRKLLEQRSYVNKVFYLFSVNYGIFDKTPYSEIQNNISDFENVYNLLEDDISQKCLIAFLQTRLTGNNAYIENVCCTEQNFYNNDIFKVTSNEVFIDVGAYDGDTIKLFLSQCDGKYDTIYALEPDQHNLDKLIKYINQKGLENIYVSDLGVWSSEGVLSFASSQEQISSVVPNTTDKPSDSKIFVKPLDTVFDYQKPVSLIKINYLEGVEEAILGASNLLKSHKPKLAITIGFNCDNIRTIPRLIKDLNHDYKLYLRYNRGMISALTLYGIIE